MLGYDRVNVGANFVRGAFLATKHQMIRCGGVSTVLMENLRPLRDGACGVACYLFFWFSAGVFFVSWFLGQLVGLVFVEILDHENLFITCMLASRVRSWTFLL